MEILIFVGIFIIEYLKYFLGFRLLFEEKIKRFWPVFVGFIVYLFILFDQRFMEYEIRLIMFVIVISTLFLSLNFKIRHRIMHALISLFIITCLDGITLMPVRFILKTYQSNAPTSNLEYLICSIISFCVLIIVFMLKQSNLLSNSKIIKFIRKWIYFFIAVMGVFLLITIAGLNMAREYISDNRVSIIMALLSTVSGLSILIIAVFMIFIKKSNEEMEILIESERKLKDMYIKYYQTQLEREEDTRRYRHDLSKHLVCLSELANNKNMEMINDYIIQMQGQMNYIQKKTYYVGNEILDAVLNYYSQMLDDDIKILITGNCNDKVDIDSVDLCTIFSNLVQNSVEELTRRSDRKKYLNIIIQDGKKYFSIEIKNSISSGNRKECDEFFYTDKSDKKNHGLGLKNVKDIIEKYKGLFEIKREGDYVIAKVVLEKKFNHLRS